MDEWKFEFVEETGALSWVKAGAKPNITLEVGGTILLDLRDGEVIGAEIILDGKSLKRLKSLFKK